MTPTCRPRMGSRRVGADVRSRVARWGGVAREGGVVRRARGMGDGKYDACVARARVGVVRARESRDGGILFDLMCWGSMDGAGGGDCGVARVRFALAFARETDGAYRVPYTTQDYYITRIRCLVRKAFTRLFPFSR